MRDRSDAWSVVPAFSRMALRFEGVKKAGAASTPPWAHFDLGFAARAKAVAEGEMREWGEGWRRWREQPC